ncbi:hypothetical protein [Aquimarina sp. LLG6339-5]|uniref:hypothetical protein n=1 Tax=Aquimarina sp. LLG6339-5 TaxID=3160830 RepID=UPI003865E1A4
MKQKDKLLIKLIKTIQLDTPSTDFTENVIGVLKEENTLIEKKVDIIHRYNLDRDLLPSISNSFSAKTKEALQENLKEKVAKPLVPEKTKVILTSIFIIGYILLLLDELFLDIFYVSDKIFFRREWFQELLDTSSVFFIGAFSLIILLLLDVCIKKNITLNK